MSTIRVGRTRQTRLLHLPPQPVDAIPRHPLHRQPLLQPLRVPQHSVVPPALELDLTRPIRPGRHSSRRGFTVHKQQKGEQLFIIYCCCSRPKDTGHRSWYVGLARRSAAGCTYVHMQCEQNPGERPWTVLKRYVGSGDTTPRYVGILPPRKKKSNHGVPIDNHLDAHSFTYITMTNHTLREPPSPPLRNGLQQPPSVNCSTTTRVDTSAEGWDWEGLVDNYWKNMIVSAWCGRHLAPYIKAPPFKNLEIYIH